MNLDYRTLNDNGRPLVFVGRSFHNRCMYDFFKKSRQCLHLSFEEIEQKSISWVSDHQFICSMSNVSFKMKVVSLLTQRSAEFFSVISSTSAIGHRVAIGLGVFINQFNVIYDDSSIGDHATISNYVHVSHETVVGSFNHISPHVYLCYTKLGQGNFVGLRSGFFGYPDKRITTADFCNFVAESRVTESVTHAGTWAGKKLFDRRSSLELAL